METMKRFYNVKSYRSNFKYDKIIMDHDTDFYNNYVLYTYKNKKPNIEEELKYFQEYEKTKSNDLKQEIISKFLYLPIKLAYNYTNRGIDFEDLVQEGNIGLMKAIEKFDYKKGYRFETFATWEIRSSMTRAIENNSNLIRVPSHIYSKVIKMLRCYESFIDNYSREPEKDEFIDYIWVDKKDFQYLLDLYTDIVSIDETVSIDEEKMSLLDTISYDYDNGFEETSDKKIYQDHIIEILKEGLNEQQFDVITSRFGFNGKEETLEEISKRYNVTKERIRQVESKALRLTRKIIIKDDEITPVKRIG